MITRYTYGDIVWADVDSPTDEDVRELMKTYALAPGLADTIRHQSPTPHIAHYDGAVIAVMHFPAYKHSHTHQRQEVDCIITPDALITVRYDTVDPIHKFAKLFEVSGELEKGLPEHTAGLAAALLAKLYRAIEHELDYIHDWLADIEESVFAGRERKMVFELSRVSRQLLHFQEALNNHTTVLRDLSQTVQEAFGDAHASHIEPLIEQHSRLYDRVAHQWRVLEALRSTNDSLLSTKQNEVMKILTILAFVTFPPTLITNIFSMNTTTLPIVGTTYDFWIILGAMGALTLAFFAFFVYKRWL